MVVDDDKSGKWSWIVDRRPHAVVAQECIHLGGSWPWSMAVVNRMNQHPVSIPDSLAFSVHICTRITISKRFGHWANNDLRTIVIAKQFE